jgi:hypothetical protein
VLPIELAMSDIAANNPFEALPTPRPSLTWLFHPQ